MESVAAHHPQLESLVSAGQALETFGSAPSSSLPHTDYATMQDRYHQLKVGVLLFTTVAIVTTVVLLVLLQLVLLLLFSCFGIVLLLLLF